MNRHFQNNSADAFIEVSSNKYSRINAPSTMNTFELNALLNAVEDAMDKRYDTLLLLNTLLKERLIAKSVYDFLLKLYETGADFRIIIMRLYRVCSPASLIYALYMCCYTDIAVLLNKHRNGWNIAENISPCDIPKQNGSHGLSIEFYNALKKNIDNGTFVDKVRFLNAKAAHLSQELKKLNPDFTRREDCLIDKLVIAKCLVIEVTIGSEKRLEAINEIYKNKAFCHKNINKAPIYGKEACTHALAGDFENAEETMMQARLILSGVKTSWAVYYHYLNELFLKVAAFQKDPNQENKQRLLFYGFSGLRAVANENEAVQRQWKRMYISFMLYGLLSLGLFLEEVECSVSRQDHTMATTLLKEFNRLSEGMETRRDMLYAVFMSRLHEDDDINSALSYARRAKVLSDNGELRKGEKENICAFVCKLTIKASSLAV